MGLGGDQMTADVEDVVDGGVAGQKALGSTGRSKPLHPPLSSTDRFVRAFCSVVLPLALDVLCRKPEFSEGSTIRPQAVGDDFRRRETMLFQ